jgi:hypothetical protein
MITKHINMLDIDILATRAGNETVDMYNQRLQYIKNKVNKINKINDEIDIDKIIISSFIWSNIKFYKSEYPKTVLNYYQV